MLNVLGMGLAVDMRDARWVPGECQALQCNATAWTDDDVTRLTDYLFRIT